MSKTTKKRQSYNTYNTEVVRTLSQEYEVSERFVRAAINGHKTSLTAETIRKKYFQLVRPTKKAIEQFKQNPVNQEL